jgi:DNA-directed RNA polymerase subunit L
MELENAFDIFDQICEICYDVDHPVLNEALPSLEIDVEKSKSTEEILNHLQEILVLLEEAVSDYPEEEEALTQVQALVEELYN